jgi:hypothetical protein
MDSTTLEDHMQRHSVMRHALLGTPFVCAVATLLAGGAGSVAAQGEASSLILDRRGAVDSFGPGLTALWEGKVEFRLTRSAHVVLLWVGGEGEVELHYPLRSGDRTARRAGRHAVGVAEVRSPIEPPTISGAPMTGLPGQFAAPSGGIVAGRPEDDDGTTGYWALFVTDVPIRAAEVRARLAPMSREGGATAVLDRLPEVLVVGRVGLWAVYYAPVAVAR